MILGNASIESSEVSVHSSFEWTYLGSENLAPGHRLPSLRYMKYTYLFNMGYGKAPSWASRDKLTKKSFLGETMEFGDALLSDDHYVSGECPFGSLW